MSRAPLTQLLHSTRAWAGRMAVPALPLLHGTTAHARGEDFPDRIGQRDIISFKETIEIIGRGHSILPTSLRFGQRVPTTNASRYCRTRRARARVRTRPVRRPR